MIFAGYAAQAYHTVEDLQQLMGRLSHPRLQCILISFTAVMHGQLTGQDNKLNSYTFCASGHILGTLSTEQCSKHKFTYPFPVPVCRPYTLLSQPELQRHICDYSTMPNERIITASQIYHVW